MAKFTYLQEESNAPSSVKFTNESEKAESYVWDFGDGNTSEDANPEHKYYLSGKYEVQLEAKKGNKTKKTKKEVVIDAPKQCLVIVSTEFGDMVIQLYDETPKHRDNFIKLIEEGYYDGLLFHRVIDGFMVQGGDPKSKDAKSGAPLGSGGPGYQVDAEFNPKHVHVRGALAAARTGGPSNPKKKSSGSQFYIVDGKTFSESQLRQFELEKGITYTAEQKRIYMEEGGAAFLDMEYTVFGRVIQGFEVIDAIAEAKKDKRNRPVEDISMKVIAIK
jgi:peptidyl-prolyl cis-trans isomerase B (cyclophilin B)